MEQQHLASAGDLPAHVRHWPPRIDPAAASCGAEECVVSDVSRLRLYICGLRCDDHKPVVSFTAQTRAEPTYVPSSTIKQPTGRAALPRPRARRKK